MSSKSVKMRVVLLLTAAALILPACLLTGRQRSPAQTPADATAAPAPQEPQPTEDQGGKNDPLQPPAAGPTAVPSLTVLVIEQKTLKEEGAAPKYTVEVNYPVIAGADAFNRASEEIAGRVANFFKENLKTYPEIDDPALTSYSSVSMEYTVLQNNPEVVSVYYQISEYYRGAAHPAPSSAVLNYDVRNQKLLALGDLFRPGADYLKFLSDYATQELTGEEWFLFPEGALPQAENYRNWNLTPAGLQITFDPYQVAPYAAGFINVLVPYDALLGIANPNGVLAGK